MGADGKGLKTYHPELHLPIVSAGAYTISQYEKKGTTAFKPYPDFWGPPSQASGVALTYYTNQDAVIADLKGGNIDWADQVPFKAVNAVKKSTNVVVTTIPGSRDDQHHLELQSGQAEEPGAASARSEEGALDVRRP